MTKRKTLWPFGVAYMTLSVVALIYAIDRAATMPFLLVITFGAVALWLDNWPQWVGTKVVWSNADAVVMAAVVLAPPGTAPLVGALVQMPTAFIAVEARQFQAARFATNIGITTLNGFAAGVIVEAARPETAGPAIGLLLAVVLADLTMTVLSTFAVGLVAAYRNGREGLRGIARSVKVMPLRHSPVVYAAGMLASVVALVGPGWALIATLQIVVMVSYPLARARLDAKRSNLITTVTRALNGRGLVGTPHARLERLALDTGREVGLDEDQLQQLRYVALTYSMTDLFAGELAHPLDMPLRGGQKPEALSRVMYTGLALDDIADSRVCEVVDAAARFDALLTPVNDEPPTDFVVALAELRTNGCAPEIVAALGAARVASNDSMSWQRHVEAGYPSMRERPLRRR